MKYLITGANGYIGQGVVKHMLNLGADVIATDFSTEKVDKRARVVNADIFSVDNPYVFFDKPDVIIHLAWRDGFKHSSESHINDLPKHYKFISDMCKSGVQKVCIMGSMHEVGFFEGCVKENTPCAPQSLYGIAKNALRQAVELVCKDTKTSFVWLRGYYIVGNTHSGCSIFSKITDAVESGESSFPFTTGEKQFDFIDYELFCEQVSKASIQNEIMGIIECCSGVPMKLAERVESFIKENGYNINLQYGAFPDRPYDSKAIWGDSSKIDNIMKKW